MCCTAFCQVWKCFFLSSNTVFHSQNFLYNIIMDKQHFVLPSFVFQSNTSMKNTKVTQLRFKLRRIQYNKEIKKESVIATKAACQAIGHLGKMPIFIFLFGVDYFEDWSVILPLVLAVFIGTKFGKGMLGKLPEATFKKLFRIVLTLIAIRLIILNFIT